MDKGTRSFLIGIFLCVQGIGFSIVTQSCDHSHVNEVKVLAPNRDWSELLAHYEHMVAKSSAVWYNTGVCAYNLGDYAYALTCWLRAIPGSSYAEYRDIRDNIVLLEKKIINEHNRLPYVNRPGWQSYLCGLVSWMVLQFLVLLCWFFCIVMMLFAKNKTYLLTGLLLLGLIFVVMLSKYMIEQQHFGVIKNDGTSIFIGPHNYFCSENFLNQTDCVKIVKEKEGWLAIQGNGIHGWIEATKIHRV